VLEGSLAGAVLGVPIAGILYVLRISRTRPFRVLVIRATSWTGALSMTTAAHIELKKRRLMQEVSNRKTKICLLERTKVPTADDGALIGGTLLAPWVILFPKHIGLRVAERVVGGFCFGAFLGWLFIYHYHWIRYKTKTKMDIDAYEKWNKEYNGKHLGQIIKEARDMQAARTHQSSIQQPSQHPGGRNDAETKDGASDPDTEPPAGSTD